VKLGARGCTACDNDHGRYVTQSDRAGSTSILVARVLVIAEAAFLALLAMDVPLGFAWLVHLMPALVLALCVAFTWRHPVVAGACFVVLGAVATMLFHTYASLPAFLTVSAPTLLAGLLLLTEGLAGRARGAHRRI
jgi:uncharacterized protein (DUF983 family)